MAHTFERDGNKSGEFCVSFKYSGDMIFSTEASTSKASARKAIRSIKDKQAAIFVDGFTRVVKAPAQGAAKAPAAPSAAHSKPAASAAAKPVAAGKAAAKAVSAAVKPAVKTSSKK